MGKQIQLTAEQLKGVQQAELEMLQEIERICEKNKIVYSIVGGTLLGAVRHGGFIPWDDDADVAMLRSEYEKFVRACKKDLDKERFYFQDMHCTPGYRWGYGKLRKKNTLFLRCGQEHMPYEQGVFVDIFPLDYVPENYTLRRIHNLQCFLYRKFFWAEVGRTADQSLLKRVLYSIMGKVPQQKLKKSFYRFIKKSNRKKTGWVRILTFPTPNKAYGYKAKWYLESADVLFEGVKLRGIRDYEEYLSFKFGNYRELPPESERKVHPVSRIVLDTGKQNQKG